VPAAAVAAAAWVGSRNAGVVVAVAVLFHYLAPHKEVAKAGKTLVRSAAAPPRFRSGIRRRVLWAAATRLGWGGDGMEWVGFVVVVSRILGVVGALVADVARSYISVMCETHAFGSVGAAYRVLLVAVGVWAWGRVLKNNRETAYLVLCNMATLVQQRTDLFDGCAKEFFLKATDPTCVSLLKLEILSYLVNDSNAQVPGGGREEGTRYACQEGIEAQEFTVRVGAETRDTWTPDASIISMSAGAQGCVWPGLSRVGH
jgi:hypothetical protein